MDTAAAVEAIRLAVFERWGRRCRRCGAYATVDHGVPRVLGGAHDLDNLRPACARCDYSSGVTVGNQLRGAARHPERYAPRRRASARNW